MYNVEIKRPTSPISITKAKNRNKRKWKKTNQSTNQHLKCLNQSNHTKYNYAHDLLQHQFCIPIDLHQHHRQHQQQRQRPANIKILWHIPNYSFILVGFWPTVFCLDHFGTGSAFIVITAINSLLLLRYWSLFLFIDFKFSHLYCCWVFWVRTLMFCLLWLLLIFLFLPIQFNWKSIFYHCTLFNNATWWFIVQYTSD